MDGLLRSVLLQVAAMLLGGARPGEGARSAAQFCRCGGGDPLLNAARTRSIRGEGSGHPSCHICASYSLVCADHALPGVLAIVKALRECKRLWIQSVDPTEATLALRRTCRRRFAPTCRTGQAISAVQPVDVVAKLANNGELSANEAVLLAQVEIDAAMRTPAAGLFATDVEALSLLYEHGGTRYGQLVVLRELHAELANVSSERLPDDVPSMAELIAALDGTSSSFDATAGTDAIASGASLKEAERRWLVEVDEEPLNCPFLLLRPTPVACASARHVVAAAGEQGAGSGREGSAGRGRRHKVSRYAAFNQVHDVADSTSMRSLTYAQATISMHMAKLPASTVQAGVSMMMRVHVLLGGNGLNIFGRTPAGVPFVNPMELWTPPSRRRLMLLLQVNVWRDCHAAVSRSVRTGERGLLGRGTGPVGLVGAHAHGFWALASVLIEADRGNNLTRWGNLRDIVRLQLSKAATRQGQLTAALATVCVNDLT
jgi:hypothetical protein